MFESLNCDHISKRVQTVTHTERACELMVVKKNGQMFERTLLGRGEMNTMSWVLLVLGVKTKTFLHQVLN